MMTKPVLGYFQCNCMQTTALDLSSFYDESRKGVYTCSMRLTSNECKQIKQSSNFQ